MEQNKLQGVRIGVVLTGSHCSMDKVFPELYNLKDAGAEIFFILSDTVDKTDNRFYKTADLKKRIRDITSYPIINSIVGAEPIGPQKLLDLIIIIPATGNTVAKLVNGIVDTPALMAAKGHLRNQRPVVIAISTNDGLGMNAKNIGTLMNIKNIFFVPFRQDDPLGKENSLVADMGTAVDTIMYALQGKQIQPVLLGPA